MTECVFCLEKIEDDQNTSRFPNCSHIVHSSCFFEYMCHALNSKSKNISCPICRSVHIVLNIPSLETSASASVNIHNQDMMSTFETSREEDVRDVPVWPKFMLLSAVLINIILFINYVNIYD